MRRVAILGLILLLSMVLTACGGGGDGGGGDSGGGEAAGPQALELSQDHTTADGKVAFKYPGADWFVYEDLNIPYIYSNKDAQSRIGTLAFQPGQVMIQITKNSLPSSLYGDVPAEHITAFMEGLVASLNLTAGEPTETKIGEKDAAYALATGEKYSLWGCAIAVTDDMMLEVLAYTAPDDFEQQEPTIMAIVESVTYTP
ncbi:MAG: hypothetical protein JXB47_19595 [Anaerolineae bacterium]|nr:hypothetical protein [Anaerolineae bacterium]